MFSIRKGLVLLGVALAACGGPRNAPSPLYLASVEGSGEQVEARLHVEDNTIVLTGYLPGGCRPAGDYVVNGHSISMRLTGSPAGTACPAGGAPMYTTRVGPLPPGTYQVSVTLDGKEILSGQSIRIGQS